MAEEKKTGILDRALAFAQKAHQGQFRKGTDMPYIVHPIETAEIVKNMTNDEEIIAAAFLHDVIEDTMTTEEEIKKEFGTRVLGLVLAESEQIGEELQALSMEESWEIRKKEKLKKLWLEPEDVKIIALGDKLSNIRAIKRDYAALGEKLWERFHQKDKKRQGWYYHELVKALQSLSHFREWQEFQMTVDEVFPEWNR